MFNSVFGLYILDTQSWQPKTYPYIAKFCTPTLWSGRHSHTQLRTAALEKSLAHGIKSATWSWTCAQQSSLGFSLHGLHYEWLLLQLCLVVAVKKHSHIAKLWGWFHFYTNTSNNNFTVYNQFCRSLHAHVSISARDIPGNIFEVRGNRNFSFEILIYSARSPSKNATPVLHSHQL